MASGVVSVGGQSEPVAQQLRVDRRFSGIRVAHRWVIEQVGEGEPGFVAGHFEPVMKLLAKRYVERAVDEVVGLLHARSAGSLRQNTGREASSRVACWPGRPSPCRAARATSRPMSANGHRWRRSVRRNLVPDDSTHGTRISGAPPMNGMFCTCSGSTNGPASSTRMRRLRVADR